MTAAALATIGEVGKLHQLVSYTFPYMYNVYMYVEIDICSMYIVYTYTYIYTHYTLYIYIPCISISLCLSLYIYTHAHRDMWFLMIRSRRVLWDAAQGRPATEDGGSDVEGSLSDVEDEAAECPRGIGFLCFVLRKWIFQI